MSTLEINFVNIGQGDCTLIKCPNGKTVMIDCGNKYGATTDAWQTTREQKDADEAVVTQLQRKRPRPKNYNTLLDDANKKARKSLAAYNTEKDYVNVVATGTLATALTNILPASKKIDYLILTHHDDDHYSQISPLARQGIKFGKVYYSGPIKKYVGLRNNYSTTAANIGEYISLTINGITQANQTIIEDANDVTILCQTDPLTIVKDVANKFDVTILASNVHTKPADKVLGVKNFNFDSESKNSRSIVTMITFGKDKILVLGDATIATEDFLVTTYGAKLQADTMRVGHHGSDSSSSQDLINNVKPNFALISSAKYNTFGLPRQSVTDRYIAYFSTKGNVDQHDLSCYTNKNDYELQKIKKALWQTWSVADTVIGYSGT